MPAKANPRNHRNNPYVLDGLAVQVHHSAAGILWRFRTELAVLTVGSGRFLCAAPGPARCCWARRHPGGAGRWSLMVAARGRGGSSSGGPGACISRHRIQRVFYETRMHTRSGRLSLVLRIHPTEVGERALIWCRAGICFEDFEAHTGEIAAACYAREARIERSKRWAQLVRGQHRAPRHPRRASTSSPPAWHPRCPSAARTTTPPPPERGTTETGCPRRHNLARGHPRHPSHQGRRASSSWTNGPAHAAATASGATPPTTCCAAPASRTHRTSQEAEP